MVCDDVDDDDAMVSLLLWSFGQTRVFGNKAGFTQCNCVAARFFGARTVTHVESMKVRDIRTSPF